MNDCTSFTSVHKAKPVNVYQNIGNVTGSSTVAGKIYLMKNHVVGPARIQKILSEGVQL